MKKPYVKGIAFVTTQEVAAYSKWGPEEIRSHQERLAALEVAQILCSLGIAARKISLPDA